MKVLVAGAADFIRTYISCASFGKSTVGSREVPGIIKGQ